jgi:alpha-D-ribose 1-methylphosphonate 5-triphosphate diphosphatase
MGEGMMRTYITGATLVTPQETVPDGCILIEDGKIAAINPSSVSRKGVTEVSVHGDYLMPGLIDLHGDAIEQEICPRPRANLPLDFAIAQGDRKCALAGITTMFHAIGFHGDDDEYRNTNLMFELAQRIHAYNRHSLIDNKVHCRFEMTVPSTFPYIQNLTEEGVCILISLNDHTPGQGQYQDSTGIREWLKEKRGMSEAEVNRYIEERIEKAKDAELHGAKMAEYAHSASVPLASHDDEDAAKIQRRHSQGATISEFPLSFEAARAAKERGMHTIVGAPNVLRGGSTGTGVRAMDLIGAELGDCLCSDYAPSALLPAVFRVAREHGWQMHRAVTLVTTAPAAAARLSDRGALREGLRADLISVREHAGVPIVRTLWRQGHPALQTG